MSKKAENLEVVELDEMEVIEEDTEMVNDEIKEKKFFGTAWNVVKKAALPVLMLVSGVAIGKKLSGSTKAVDVSDVIELADDVTEF